MRRKESSRSNSRDCGKRIPDSPPPIQQPARSNAKSFWNWLIEFRSSWRYDQPITAIIVDVDALGEINLKRGHTIGDQVLREVAKVCANAVRSIDLVGRYDSDAFALLLLMTERESAKSIAERIRVGINAIQLPDAPSPTRITATLGVCAYPRSRCASIFDLLALTQEAQRAARVQGANQIVYG